MSDLTMIQKLKVARAMYNDSVQAVADEIGCSRGYLYECLKYPNKNREIFGKACEYINSAGVNLPDDYELKGSSNSVSH